MFLLFLLSSFFSLFFSPLFFFSSLIFLLIFCFCSLLLVLSLLSFPRLSSYFCLRRLAGSVLFSRRSLRSLVASRVPSANSNETEPAQTTPHAQSVFCSSIASGSFGRTFRRRLSLTNRCCSFWQMRRSLPDMVDRLCFWQMRKIDLPVTEAHLLSWFLFFV